MQSSHSLLCLTKKYDVKAVLDPHNYFPSKRNNPPPTHVYVILCPYNYEKEAEAVARGVPFVSLALLPNPLLRFMPVEHCQYNVRFCQGLKTVDGQSALEKGYKKLFLFVQQRCSLITNSSTIVLMTHLGQTPVFKWSKHSAWSRVPLLRFRFVGTTAGMRYEVFEGTLKVTNGLVGMAEYLPWVD